MTPAACLFSSIDSSSLTGVGALYCENNFDLTRNTPLFPVTLLILRHRLQMFAHKSEPSGIHLSAAPIDMNYPQTARGSVSGLNGYPYFAPNQDWHAQLRAHQQTAVQFNSNNYLSVSPIKQELPDDKEEQIVQQYLLNPSQLPNLSQTNLFHSFLDFDTFHLSQNQYSNNVQFNASQFVHQQQQQIGHSEISTLNPTGLLHHTTNASMNVAPISMQFPPNTVAPVARKSSPLVNTTGTTITATKHNQITLHQINTDMSQMKPLFGFDVLALPSMMMTNDTHKSIAKVVTARKQPNLFMCQHSGCDSGFTTHLALQRHLSRHLNREKKLHQCDWPGCYYATDRKGSLNRHQSVHTTECRYACKVLGCDKKYKSASGYRRHLSRQHSIAERQNLMRQNIAAK